MRAPLHTRFLPSIRAGNPRRRTLRAGAGLALGWLLAVLPISQAADWPMLGRDATRNPVSLERNAPVDWDVESGQNIRWKARVGSIAFADPVVAGGVVWLGSNNWLEGEHLWFVTARAEVVAWGLGPFYRGEGPPRERWKRDLIAEFAVYQSMTFMADRKLRSSK